MASTESSSTEKKPTGKFILFEGADRSGKTTQCGKLVQVLRNIFPDESFELWRFPDRTTPTGKLIDAYLRKEVEMDDRAVHLLFSANRWELAKKMQDTLESGTHIICDRYIYSGWVYTLAKQVPEITREWIKQCDNGLRAPDLAIFLDIDAEVLASRGGFGEERYETKERQEKVIQEFRRICTKEAMASTIYSIPIGSKDAEEVHAIVMKIVMSVCFPQSQT
jgi:dTMP kinase